MNCEFVTDKITEKNASIYFKTINLQQKLNLNHLTLTEFCAGESGAVLGFFCAVKLLVEIGLRTTFLVISTRFTYDGNALLVNHLNKVLSIR